MPFLDTLQTPPVLQAPGLSGRSGDASPRPESGPAALARLHSFAGGKRRERDPGREVRVRMQLVGALPGGRLEAAGPLRARAHYLLGNDPKRWRRKVPTFGEVRRRGV